MCGWKVGFSCQVYSELGEHEDFKPRVESWHSEIREKQEFGLSGVPYRHVVYDHMEVITS